MADDWIGALVDKIMRDVRGGMPLHDALRAAADSLAPEGAGPARCGGTVPTPEHIEECMRNLREQRAKGQGTPP